MASKKESDKIVLDTRIDDLAKHIKMKRIEAGYTSYENFAIDKGFNRMTYFRIEKGQNITYTTLLKVIDAFDLSVEEFIKGLK